MKYLTFILPYFLEYMFFISMMGISMAYLGFARKIKERELSMRPYIGLRDLRLFRKCVPIFFQNHALFGQKTKHGLSMVVVLELFKGALIQGSTVYLKRTLHHLTFNIIAIGIPDC